MDQLLEDRFQISTTFYRNRFFWPIQLRTKEHVQIVQGIYLFFFCFYDHESDQFADNPKLHHSHFLEHVRFIARLTNNNRTNFKSIERKLRNIFKTASIFY
jgi:hypothetical protein